MNPCLDRPHGAVTHRGDLFVPQIVVPAQDEHLTFFHRESGQSLGEYPFFQGLNVGLIAICGIIALVRQAQVLLGEHGLGRSVGLSVILGWLTLSLKRRA